MKNKFLLFAFVLVGCGGGGGGGGTHFSTSVSGSAPLASLTPSQQAQLCSDGQPFVRSLTTDLCKALGVLAAAELSLTNGAATNSDLQSACNSAYNACLSADAGADGGAASCDFSALNPSTCTATVAQFAACVNDLGAADDQAVAKLPSCSSVTAQNATSALSQDAGTSEPASCVTLANVCPAALAVTTTM